MIDSELNYLTDDAIVSLDTSGTTDVTVYERKFAEFDASVEYGGYTNIWKTHMAIEPLKPRRAHAINKMKMVFMLSCYSQEGRIPYNIIPFNFTITDGHNKQNLITKVNKKNTKTGPLILFQDQTFTAWTFQYREVEAKIPFEAYPFVRFDLPMYASNTFKFIVTMLLIVNQPYSNRFIFSSLVVDLDLEHLYIDRLFDSYNHVNIPRSEIRDHLG